MKNVFLNVVFLLGCFVIGQNCHAAGHEENSYKYTGSNLSQINKLFFTENKGQITDQYSNQRNDIQFAVKSPGGLNIFVGNGALHYQFNDCNVAAQKAGLKKDNHAPLKMHADAGEELNKAITIYMQRMDVELVGANANTEVIKENVRAVYENYFTASTAGKCVTAYSYERVTYKNIYNNIDWVLYFKDGHLEYDFVLHTGARVSDIQIKYAGMTDLSVMPDGSLLATTPLGTVKEKAPQSFTATGTSVGSKYRLLNNILSFQVGAYTGDLVIDPGVEWATYFGGSANDDVETITTDKNGYVYMAGVTYSSNNIATIGAYQTVYHTGNYDVFIARFNSAGARIWSTYYGGDEADVAADITTDGAAIYVVGETYSPTGIATPGSYQANSAVTPDAFIAKFDINGMLQWGSYYGGTAFEEAYKVAIDKAGNLVMVGNSASNTGIASAGAYQTTNAGGTNGVDGFIAKFTPAGSRLWATYYGGSGDDLIFDITVDEHNNYYIAGATESTAGFATPGAYQTVAGGGGRDAFLAKFSSSGIRQWCTYLGGTKFDFGYYLAIDSSQHIYLAGYSKSATGIATPGAYQSILKDTLLTAYGNAFLAKFDTLGAISWSTYYGGNTFIIMDKMCTDRFGHIYLTGYTRDSSYIATPDGIVPVYPGGDVCFLAQFDQAGAFTWGTYYGHDQISGYAMAVDTAGSIYIAGQADVNSNIGTAGGYQPAYGGGGSDGFLTKIYICNMPVAGAIIGPISVCAGATITLSDTSLTGVWTVSNALATVSNGGVVTGIAAGTDTVTYTVSNICGTNSATLIITVKPLPEAGIIGTTAVCQGEPVTLTASGGSSYSWNNSLGSNAQVTATPTGNTTYVVTVTGANSCSAMASQTVNVTSLPNANISGPVKICAGDTANFIATGGGTYQWANALGSNPTINVALVATTIYTVTVTTGVNCTASATTTVTVNQPAASQFNHAICSGSGYTFGGINYTVAGNYIDTLQTIEGCDSVVTLNLSIIPLPDATLTAAGDTVLCQGDSVALNAPAGSTTYSWSNSANTEGIIVKTSGNYAVTVSDANSCSATSNAVTVTVNPLPVVPVITMSGDTLISTVATSYQWYRDSVIVSNATDQTLGITQNGNYTVEITDINGCKNTSNVFNVTNVNVQSVNAGFDVKLYPNPNNGTFMLEFSDNETRDIEITDAIGRVIITATGIQKQKQFDLNQKSPGVYFLNIKQQGAIRSIRFSKLN